MPPPDAPRPRLLAVDAGLRAGLAVYDSDGRLEAYRSTNFGALSRLRKAVYGVISEVAGVTHLVIEGGGGGIAAPWLKEARRRKLSVRQVDARVWREALLVPRSRRRGVDAKEAADALAREVIEWSDAPRPTSLRHDAAEAIVIGLWGVLEAGWLTSLPDGLR